MAVFDLFISEAARQDIIEAFDWYHEIDRSLSESLTDHIEAGLVAIQQDPNLFQKRYKTIRIRFIKRFP